MTAYLFMEHLDVPLSLLLFYVSLLEILSQNQLTDQSTCL